MNDKGDPSPEAMPTLGKRYIVFLQQSPHHHPGQGYTVLKLANYSDEEAAKLKQLIQTLPPPVK